MKIYNNILELIGKTPIIKLSNFSKNASIFGKVEFFNPGKSIKDRIALAMIEGAEKEGKIDKNTVILEATSGNTGIGLAMVCAAKGYRLVIAMPESMSIERRKLISVFGAEIILTSAEKGMNGAIEKIEELSQKFEKSFIPMQFENKYNPLIHEKTTALEIWNDMDGKIDYLIAGVGTGGTISGIGKILKEKNPNIKIVAVEPYDSSVLSGFEAGKHRIQGIGAGFVPKNLDRNVIDDITRIKNEEAYDMARMLVKKEALFCGVSSGAALGRSSENC